MEINSGEIYLADLNPMVGSEQEVMRPVLIIQYFNNCKTATIAPIVSGKRLEYLPTHVEIQLDNTPKASVVLLEQFCQLNINKLTNKISELSSEEMESINNILSIGFGLK